jgi:arabinose-5-phosphate isomerase
VTPAETARCVIRAEINGLFQLAQNIDDQNFDAAVEVLADCGRVIVTGVGKSGHIARKIAATLASLGTPAAFLDPADASHGDLGMIDPSQDTILVLSKSGESAELTDILDFAAARDMPVVAITAVAHSPVAQAADAVLLLPNAAEACYLGLAPTTSTAMMLALGDSLAIALAEGAGFTAADFMRLHPGGSLGRGAARHAA